MSDTFKDRHAKLGCMVLILFPKVMQTILKFYVTPQGLKRKYLKKNIHFIFTENEIVLMDKLPNMDELTIDICYKILKSEDMLDEPKCKWGNVPHDTELEMADDIQRLINATNSIISIKSEEVTKEYSEMLQEEIKLMIRRIDSFLEKDALGSLYNSLYTTETDSSFILQGLTRLKAIKDSLLNTASSENGEWYSRISMAIIETFPNILRDVLQSGISANQLYQKCVPVLKDFVPEQQTNLVKLQHTNTYDSLDITLIYKLLRKFLLIPPPTKGWGSIPDKLDITLGDDIERIRGYRNQLAHRCDTNIDKNMFDDYFDNFRDIGQRMDLYFYPKRDYEHRIIWHKTCMMDSEMQAKYENAMKEIENIKMRFEKMPVKFYWGESFDRCLKNLRSMLKDEKAEGREKVRVQIIFQNKEDVETTINILNSLKNEINEGLTGIEFIDATKGSVVLNIDIQLEMLETDEKLQTTMGFFIEKILELFTTSPTESIAMVLLPVEDYTQWKKSKHIEEQVYLVFNIEAQLFETDDKMEEQLGKISDTVIKHSGGSGTNRNITATLLPISLVFSKGSPGEKAQTEDSGFTDKITGIKDPLPTDQSSSSHETVPNEKAKDEDKNLTKVVDNVPTKTASGNVSEPTVENKSNQSNELKDDSSEKPSYKLQPGNTPSDKLQPGSTLSDKLQSGNTPSDKLQLGSTPSDKLQPEHAPSDNQQNKNYSTGYNRSKFSNSCDEQDKNMSKKMKETDSKKKKKKKKKPDKYDPLPHSIIQNYYGYVDVVNLGNDMVNIVEKVVKVPIVETFQQTFTISADQMKVLLKVSESVGIFYGPRGTGTCWRIGEDKVMTAAHVVKDNIWSTFIKCLNEQKYKDCYVNFNYNGKKKPDTDFKDVFDIERTVYLDETLDVAVVKLKREIHKEFPPPLEFFEVLDPDKNDDEHIFLIGHDKGDKLHINYGIGLWNPTEKRLTDLEKFCQEYGKENSYKDLDRKDRLVIKCKFVCGASGSPGVVIRGDKANVVIMYTRGYPDFYFSKNFPEKDRRAFPDERLLQQGVNIGHVFESMTKNKMYLDLRNEIFPHVASEEQQQLNCQHQYAIDGAKKSYPESTFKNVKDLEDHITVRQEIENNTSTWTTCTEGHSETIPDLAKYNRQLSYALAIDEREDIAYPDMKPPVDDTDNILQHGHSQNIAFHRNEQNVTQETKLDVNKDSQSQMENASSENLDMVQEEK